MFRSEEMVLCQLFVQQEAAFAAVHLLGEASVVEFRDLNAEVHPMMRKFVNEVRRCEELERKLRYIEQEMGKDGVAVDAPRHLPRHQSRPALNPRDIIELEANLEKTESEIMELSRSAANLQSSFVELTEMQQVLEKAQVFLKELEELPSKVFGGEDRGRLGVTAGVLPRERLAAFETMLWRVSRGNVFLRQADLDDLVKDPKTGLEVQKTVFVIFFQGENLRSAVTKVCSGFRATTYPCPSTALERAETLRDLRVRLQDLILILDQTWFHRHRVLAAVRKELHEWRVVAVRTKAVYHTLNMFNMDVTNKCLIGECWVPVRDLAALRHVLLQGGALSGSSVPSFVNVIPTALQPPTFVPTNRFTAGFQALIDAYSVASYREVNPAVYSIVTFPFLFAVMFGDLGHGLLMALFALAMVLGEDRLASQVRGSEIMSIFFGGRYIILLMGLFSMYTGLMYNDLFSVSVNLVGWSAWAAPPLSELQPGPTTLDPSKQYQGVPYPVGLDPVWQFAENKIIFLNSFKMKLSIIIGILHMVFGVSLSVFNHVSNRRPVMILLDFLPKILFLLLLFGYLAALIVFKWWKYGPEQGAEDVALSPGCAPSVLITFINMMLRNHPEVPAGSACSPWMYEGQAGVEQALLYSALCCVPFMLLARPAYILCTQHRRRPRRPRNLTPKDAVHPVMSPIRGMDDDDAEDSNVADDDAVVETAATTPVPDDDAVTWRHDDDDDDESEDKAAEDEEPFGEMMVHQCIHTVEYVLSTVSHTASYLRLWALSLAHSQLSHVLWSMVLRKGLAMQWLLPLLFAGWAFFTVAILVLMEGLSAFLHTLRLHWVEFMSKFYEGEGHPFRPFSFKSIFEFVDKTGVRV